MQPLGEFLTECGARLAPFERSRVGRAGCGVSLTALACAGAALASGLYSPAGPAAAIRFMVLIGLGAVVALFLVYAAAETLAERSVLRRIRTYAEQRGCDLETLASAAEGRRDRIAGGRRLAALLESLRGSGPGGSAAQ